MVIEGRCLCHHSLKSIHLSGAASAPQYAEDEDSAASDLHCSELNMGIGATERHGHLRHNGLQCVEKSEASNSAVRRKMLKTPERFKYRGSSSSRMKHNNHAQSCMELKMQFMDKVPGTNGHNKHEDGNNADQTDVVLHQKLEEGEAQEDIEGIKVKLDDTHLSDHIMRTLS